MAARAIMRKVTDLKPHSFLPLSNRVLTYPGRRRSTAEPLYSTAIALTTRDLEMQNFEEWKLKSFQEWNIKSFEEIAQTIKNEGVKLEKIKGVKLEDLNLIDGRLMMINCFRSILELWDKARLEKQRKHLEEGWAILRDFLCSNGMEDCHHRLLLSINHGVSRGEEENIITGFATGSPEKGVTSLRRSVVTQCPDDPYELPRHAVDGVLCITTKDAFSLYDPTTGNTSPWIETTIKTHNGGKPKRQIESIALGYTPQSLRHKVVCISTYVNKRKMATEEKKKRFTFVPEEDSKEQVVVEVLDVRANTWVTGEPEWRRLKGDELPLTYCLGDRIAFMDGPVYVDGKICWLVCYGTPDMCILTFHVETESFECITLPDFIVNEFMDSARHVRSMLMEVDGHVAILKSTSDQQETSSLCICRTYSESDDVSWTEEKVSVPYDYLSPDYSVEALKRTDLIFVQSHDRISYYNRKTGESVCFEIPALLRHHQLGWGRMMQLH